VQENVQHRTMAQRDADKTVKSRDLVALEGREIFFIQVSQESFGISKLPGAFSALARREKKMVLKHETLASPFLRRTRGVYNTAFPASERKSADLANARNARWAARFARAVPS